MKAGEFARLQSTFTTWFMALASAPTLERTGVEPEVLAVIGPAHFEPTLGLPLHEYVKLPAATEGPPAVANSAA